MSLQLTAETITNALASIHPVDPDTAQRLAIWTETLATWSRAQRLVGWRTGRDLLDKGLADAWRARSVLVDLTFDAVVDVGSGSGLPGLILAADLPDTPVHLVDSRRKRASFLTAAARAMGLTQVVVHHGRADAIRIALQLPDSLLFVSRALAAPAETLVEASLWGASAALVGTSKARLDAGGVWPPEGWRQSHGTFRRTTDVDLHEILFPVGS